MTKISRDGKSCASVRLRDSSDGLAKSISILLSDTKNTLL